jgi:hypothetical protein
MKKFNDWLAVKITKAVGSMWCAYIFTALALISLPSAIASGNVITIVSWVAQTFLQLVLLSVILKGQNLQGERVEQVILRIDKNTDKIERYTEKISQMVNLIEKEEEKEIQTLNTRK